MKVKGLVLCMLCALMIASPASGSGYLNPDIGATSLGMGVSVVAKVDDLTAIYFNPAGLTKLKGTHFYVSPRYIDLNSEYTSSMGGPRAESGDPSWVGYGGFSTDLGRDDLVIGAAVYAPFGLNLAWPGEGSQRYSVTDVLLKAIYITPSIAYKVNDRFSIGGGISIVTSEAELKKKTNPFLDDPSHPYFMDPAFDIGITIEGDDLAIGGDIGFQYKLRDNVTVGFLYLSEVTLELEGSFVADIPDTLLSTFQGISRFKENGKLELTMPHQIRTGVFWQANDQLGMELDFNWINWGSNEEIYFDFENTTPLTVEDQTLERNWDDSITIRLGAEYKINDRIIVRGGYIFDQTPIPDETLDCILPDADKNIITLGAGYRFDNGVALDLAYGYFAYEKREINNSVHLPPTNGVYESTINMLAFSIGYSF